MIRGEGHSYYNFALTVCLFISKFEQPVLDFGQPTVVVVALVDDLFEVDLIFVPQFEVFQSQSVPQGGHLLLHLKQDYFIWENLNQIRSLHLKPVQCQRIRVHEEQVRRDEAVGQKLDAVNQMEGVEGRRRLDLESGQI